MPRNLATGLSLLSLLALLATALPTTPARAADRRFALVIGHNGSDDPALAPLRYADDDAMRYAELLEHVAERVTVLTELDDDTRRLVGRLTLPQPTRRAVIASLTALRTHMDAARAAGDRPVLYFVYSGHGNYDAEGRGYVHLADGRFTTRDLYHHLFQPSGADPVILLVDACNAALLVNSRGAGERRPVQPSRLNLESYPNVGVILSSSSVGETHEWARYLAGVFSHEVRSGLVGPADLNDDGRITFAELAAFVAAANDEVKNPTVRISAYVRPPLTDPELPLVDFNRLGAGAARFPTRVRVDGAFSGRAYVVDQDLVRYADFHAAPGQPFTLALPERSGGFVLVHDSDEYVIAAGAQGDLALADLTRRRRTVLSARGNHSEYFDRTLFHRPFGRSFANGYLRHDYLDSLAVERPVPAPWYDNTPAWATLGMGVAGLIAGGATYGAAAAAADDAAATPWADERLQRNADAASLGTAGGVMLGVGAAAVVGSALWFALDRPLQTERYRPPLEIQVGPTGVTLTGGL
jgi:hypothetical protein